MSDGAAPPVLAFDVNETLLDLGVLDPLFEELVGDAELRGAWFGSALQLAFVGGLTGRYADFTACQRAALHMTAARAGRALPASAPDRVVDAMRLLPPHPEVGAVLGRLGTAGFRLVALTNSAPDVAGRQLDHAGLTSFFEAVFSAGEVRVLKPAAEPYRMVAQRCGVGIEETCLVAAHAWDVSGALAAGARAAFVARAGAVPSPLGPRPDWVGRDLSEVAGLLVAARK
ncbi:haloacid dehalogenase type II [Amycolatopsis jiangsuensis]|uniref:2-haloacid dehalogenase n=1 Tax=Amycolatopsis jiangsuensis TaxID=1181879 RepID=A0A840J801_9PSEU|nr:haloacid dehalogenase type II [Amycolatopsis jiangsuensis]MBB4689552.1 2-haloacid dehalogenase [Amycolatopsis jiangsuensis]